MAGQGFSHAAEFTFLGCHSERTLVREESAVLLPDTCRFRFDARSHSMRKCFAMLSFLCLVSLAAWSQAAPASKAAKKPGSAAKSTGSGQPTAIIDTTAGNLNCKLFPDQPPIGVANFIDLAEGTNDWT